MGDPQIREICRYGRPAGMADLQMLLIFRKLQMCRHGRSADLGHGHRRDSNLVLPGSQSVGQIISWAILGSAFLKQLLCARHSCAHVGPKRNDQYTSFGKHIYWFYSPLFAFISDYSNYLCHFVYFSCCYLPYPFKFNICLAVVPFISLLCCCYSIRRRCFNLE